MNRSFIRSGLGKALSILLSFILAFSVLIVPLSVATTASAGTSVSGSTVSGISSSIYVPSSYKSGTKVPLYVAMHGCTQTYTQFATSSNINSLADEKGFIVLHLQQSSSNNMRTCFKWYSDQSRTSTEPKAIISIIDDVKSKYTIDDDKVFCFGFSAGAAMAHLLCACYPDVFSGGGIGSGLPYKGATLLNYSTAMSSGTSVSNENLASYIVSGMGSYSRTIPMIVFHGTNDSTVNYKNGAACTMSWVLAMNQIGADINTTPTKTSGSNYTVESYIDNNTGKTIVQYYLVSNMDHAWSGGKGSSYAYASGPDATRIMYEFFEEYWSDSTPSDKTSPVTSINPAAGSYTSEVTVSFSTDEEATTYYTTDGTTPTTSSAVYNGGFVLNADATVKFFSVDSEGNVEDVKSVSYIVITGDVKGTSYEIDIDGRPARLYVSGKYRQGINMPLVVMLHGDGQTAEQFELLTNMNNVADDKGFLVLYLSADDKNPLTSWDWYSKDVQAGAGDADYIVTAINTIKSGYSIDDGKVYAVGFGSGAAMANIVAATSPKLIKAIAVVSGTQYAAASDFNGSFNAKENVSSALSQAIVDTMGANGDVTPVIVIHGENDETFSAVNANLTISQWAGANDMLDNETDDDSVFDEPTTVQTLSSYTKHVYKNANGLVLMEKYIISNMGYAWSGGNIAGDYVYASGPDASELIYDFFTRTTDLDYYVKPIEKDVTPPVTTPLTDGGTYEESVRVGFSVDEAATTYYTLDGSTPTTASKVYTSAFVLAETTTVKFFSVDESGNAESVKTVVYTIIEKQYSTLEITYDKSLSGYAGTITYFGYGTDVVKAGLAGLYNGESYRGIISFDTSKVNPSGIESAVLRLYIGSWGSAVNSISIDIVNGYFGSSGIQLADFNATASATGIATSSPVSSGYIDITIPASAYAHIGEHTEFRVCSTITNGFSESVVQISNAVLIVNQSARAASYSLRSSAYALSDSVSFEDVALKNAIINAGYDTNNDGNLSLSEMEAIYGLDLSNLGITSVAGLEYATNLKYIDLSNNNLTGIDSLYACTRLQYVNISTNSITDISALANADEMFILVADNNNISDISALEGNVSLVSISFAQNNIEDITAISGIDSLRSVDLSGNKIADINTLTALSYLNYIYLADNDIESLSALNGLDYLFYINVELNRLDLVDDSENVAIIDALISNGADVVVGEQKQPIPDGEILDVSYVVDGDYVIFTVTTTPDFNRVKVTTTDNLSGYIKYNSACVIDENGNTVYTLKVPSIVGTTTYAFDGRLSATGIYESTYYYLDVTVELVEIFKSVSYEIVGDKIVFTVVTAAGDYNRIKVTTADNLKGSLGVASSYTVNADGNYVWTVKANAPDTTTTYAFDLRTTDMKYLKDYYYTEVEYVERVIFKSTSYEIKDGKVIFTVVTAPGDYNRVKISALDNITSYVKYVDTYTVNADGDYVWTLKFNAPASATEYALDIRMASVMKYVKDYYYVTVDPAAFEPETSFISGSGVIKDGKLMLTIVTKPTAINRVKVMLTSDQSTHIKLIDKYTIDANGNYVWTATIAAPSETTSYTCDVRSSETIRYMKDYFTFEVAVEEKAEIYKSVSYEMSGGKVIFTVVTAPGDFDRIKVANANDVKTSLGVGSFTVNENGDYVWTVKTNAPTESTSYAFDLRIANEYKYLKDYYYYNVVI